jgi:two-component system cell cycle sensor histidine kinase/response regulator CckA
VTENPARQPLPSTRDDLFGLVPVAVGLAVLTGWLLDVGALRGGVLTWAAMKPNTALAFVAVGSALLLIGRDHRRRLSVVPLVIAGSLAAATLAEWALGVDLGIDRLIADVETTLGDDSPGRMALPAAAALLAIVVALCLLSTRSPLPIIAGQVLAAAGLVSSLISVAGYLYGVPRLAGRFSDRFTAMPIHTSLVLGIVFVGVLRLRRHAGPVREVTSSASGGRLARRLLPAAVVTPLGLGWLRWQAQQAGLVDTQTGLALFAVANVIAFSALVWWTARSLSSTDRDRISAQTDLASSDSRVQAFLDMAPAAMFAKDLEGRFLIANQQMESLFGVRHEHIVGRTTADFTTDATAATMSARDREVIASKAATRYEESHEGRDGLRQTRTTVRFPLLDKDGQIYAIGGMSIDVTAQREAEAELDRLQTRLQQADRLDSLGQLAGGIAHDFNNLLAVILNYGAFVAEETPDGPVRDDVEVIRQTAERGAALTRQLLAFTRQEKAMVETLDLGEVIHGIEDLFRRTLPSDIATHLHIDDGLWPILAARAQMEQILVNLIVNARDAMPDGGSLTIEVGNIDFDAVTAGEHIGIAPGRYIRWAVSDTGTGMPEAVRTRAFEPFFTTKGSAKGTGLGLATVYGIVKQNGGDLDVYSEEGRGTTVKIYLPASETTVRAPAGATSRPITRGDGQHILVVEDEDILRGALTRILTDHGYLVTAVASAEEALPAAFSRATEPDLLITDVILTGRSGPQLADDLTSMWPALPVLFMSGYTGNALERLAMPDGHTHILEKPFGSLALLGHVTDLIHAPPLPGG